GESAPSNAEIFARYRRLLPRDWPGGEVATAKWSRAGSDLLLNVSSEKLATYPTVDFYPLPQGNTVTGHPSVQPRHANEVSFRIPIESSDENLSSIQGLVVFSQNPNADDRAAWQIATSPQTFGTSSTPAPVGRGVATFLFFGFVGGIILNLMPCVLPVISLKIFGFMQYAGQ